MPFGMRELTVAFPLGLAIVFFIYKLDAFFPGYRVFDPKEQFNHKQDIMTYHLEPIRDRDTGRIVAYRHVNDAPRPPE